MTRITLFGLLVASLALGLAGVAQTADRSEGGPLKALAHVNFPETGRQGHGLKNVGNILKEAPDTRSRSSATKPGPSTPMRSRP